MKVAAYQAPLLAAGSMGALDLIRARVRACEAEGVEILCCPEAILGGLADQIDDPARFAIRSEPAQLDAVLAPLASDVTTTIIGFTELGEDGFLYNAAAVFHRGTVAGVYRKLHPAIRQSVYRAGRHVPVFRVGALTFGIVICNDSNFPELANQIASRCNGAVRPQQQRAPPAEGRSRARDRGQERRRGDGDRERDVGHPRRCRRPGAELTSHGSSAIVNPKGTVVRSAVAMSEDVIAAAIEVTPRMTVGDKTPN